MTTLEAIEILVRICWLLGAVAFVLGLARMNSPATARNGNLVSAGGMAIAIGATAVLILARQVLDPESFGIRISTWALIIGGIVMWVVDAMFKRPKILHVEEMGPLEAIWIGAIQIFSAVFPGTSRSMCTIAAGQVFSMSRAAALEFSFFLSIPIMMAATLKELKDFLRPPIDVLTGTRPAPIHLTGDQWGVLLLGTAVSFVVAWVVIAWFMKWVQKHGFIPFAIYRLVAGAVFLALAFKGA